MPTKKKTFTITLNKETINLLKYLATQKQISVFYFAQDLILETLDYREEKALSDIAKSRDIKHAKKLKHDKIWKS